MLSPAIMIGPQAAHRAMIALCGIVLMAATAGPVRAAGCSFEPQGEGRVAAVIDARTFRLQDGREIRLAGIEPVATEKVAAEAATADRASALAAIALVREVLGAGTITLFPVGHFGGVVSIRGLPPARVLAAAPGALLLLGYACALVRRRRRRPT